MRQSNCCSTPAPRSNAAKQWFEELCSSKAEDGRLEWFLVGVSKSLHSQIFLGILATWPDHRTWGLYIILLCLLSTHLANFFLACPRKKISRSLYRILCCLSSCVWDDHPGLLILQSPFKASCHLANM